MTTLVRTLPRRAVAGYLQLVRLPLTAVERTAHKTGAEHWPPAVAFERFEARVESVVGALVHDDELVERGRLRQTKIGQLDKAAELRTLAEQEKAQADEKAKQRREQVAQERTATARRTRQRKQELAAQAERRETDVERAAAKKTAAARRRKARQEEQIAERERAAKAATLTEQSRAIDVTKAALDADETVDVIEETIEATKQVRKAQ